MVGAEPVEGPHQPVTGEATGGSAPCPGLPVDTSLSQSGTFWVTSIPNCLRPPDSLPSPPSFSMRPAPANASGWCSTTHPAP